MKLAVCPGSFDPITNGHLDIIQRASRMFDHVVVLVAYNPQKNNRAFTVKERLEMIDACIQGLDNVRSDSYPGLVADYLEQVGGCAIVKGLRAVSDFEYEFQQAMANKRLNPKADTVFLTTASENMFLSSSLVKQIAQFGGAIQEFVPACIVGRIQKRLCISGQTPDAAAISEGDANNECD